MAIGITSEPMGATIEVLPGVRIAERAIAEKADYRGFNVRAYVHVVAGPRVAVIKLEVTQLEGGAEVTSDALRSIAIQDFVREWIAFEVQRNNPDLVEGEMLTAHALFSVSQVEELKSMGLVDEKLEAIGRLYRYAELLGDAPTVAVEQVFGISRSTAGNWIGRARAAGHIPPVGEGK